MTTTNNELPSDLEPTGDICVSLFVPNDTEWLWLLVKLLSHGAAKRYWKGENSQTLLMASNWEERVVTPLIEKLLAGDLCSTGGAMSCTDVADCIDNEEVVQDAIENSITGNGFSPNPDTNISPSPSPTLSETSKAENLLPVSLDCENLPLVMGLARAIVKELHDSAEDFFEGLEYATNAAEAAVFVVENIPFAKPAASLLEFADWVLETMKETYQAAYNQDSEDELACMIYCHMIDTCSLSINDLVSLYEDKGSITIPPGNDINEVLSFAIETSLSADIITVAIFHYQILRLLAWGSYGGFSAAYLRMIINNNVSAYDYSYDLCLDCPPDETPTDYWCLYYDFRLGQFETQSTVWNGGQNDGAWGGDGYYCNKNSASTQNISFGIADLGAAYVIRAIGERSVRRGSVGNGTNDIATNDIYPNANFSGTPATMGVGANTANTNKVEMAGITPSQSASFRSIRHRGRVSGSAVNSEFRVYGFVVWGLAGAGDTKPQRAVWAGDTLPNGAAELFPDNQLGFFAP